MSAQLADVRPCLPSCGGTMRLRAIVKATGFGLYRCQNPKCKREAIETAFPQVSDSTGQDIQSKYRPGQEIPE